MYFSSTPYLTGPLMTLICQVWKVLCMCHNSLRPVTTEAAKKLTASATTAIYISISPGFQSVHSSDLNSGLSCHLKTWTWIPITLYFVDVLCIAFSTLQRKIPCGLFWTLFILWQQSGSTLLWNSDSLLVQRGKLSVTTQEIHSGVLQRWSQHGCIAIHSLVGGD